MLRWYVRFTIYFEENLIVQENECSVNNDDEWGCAFMGGWVSECEC